MREWRSSRHLQFSAYLVVDGKGRSTVLCLKRRSRFSHQTLSLVVDISRLPLYNQDLELDLPEAVKELKKKIRGADAILFASPEHNYSVTAVLKNAIEWGNRPPRDASWNGKPTAIISASSSLRGGARAQLHLRQIMIDLNMYPINRPLLLVANAKDKFNEDLQLTDEETLQTLRDVLSSLVEWTRRLQQ